MAAGRRRRLSTTWRTAVTTRSATIFQTPPDPTQWYPACPAGTAPTSASTSSERTPFHHVHPQHLVHRRRAAGDQLETAGAHHPRQATGAVQDAVRPDRCAG